MKALVLTQVGKLEYKEIPKPEPKEGEVLVKVMACGICGSDIPRAYRDGAHNMPLVPGHEFSGCVESVGENVSDKWIGKRVGVFPLIPCKKCGPCMNRQYEMCRNYGYLGSRQNGGFAEYVTVPQWNLIELPDSVSYEAAAMLEPMSVAVHAMSRSMSRSLCNRDGYPVSEMQDAARRGSTSTKSMLGVDHEKAYIVICGLGTIGTLIVMFLLDAGYKNILVIGNKEFQRKTMAGLGIPEDNYCDSGKDNAYDFVMDRTGGHGADIFFECVGSNSVASLAANCAAPAGSVCFVGNPHSDMCFEKNVYWKILRNQLKIYGTWNSSFLGEGEGDDDWHYVIERIKSRSIHPEELITQRYPLEEIIKGFELMRDKKEDYIKVMASFDI